MLAFSHSWFSSPLPFPLALSTTLFPVSYISVTAFSFGVGLDHWKLRADGSESVMLVSVFYRISSSRTPGIGQSLLDCHLVSRLLLTSITTGRSAGQGGPTSWGRSPVRLAGEGKLSILGEGLNLCEVTLSLCRGCSASPSSCWSLTLNSKLFSIYFKYRWG